MFTRATYQRRPALTTVDERIEDRLTRLGVRYTRGRRSVVSALARSDGPRSAAELAAALGPRVPVSSLYRSLGVLEEAGVVSPHHGVKGVTRYELAEWLTGHHHHLVCIACGLVEDVDVPRGREAPVLDLVEDLANRSGFVAIDHALEIEGRCARCA